MGPLTGERSAQLKKIAAGQCRQNGDSAGLRGLVSRPSVARSRFSGTICFPLRVVDPPGTAGPGGRRPIQPDKPQRPLPHATPCRHPIAGHADKGGIARPGRRSVSTTDRWPAHPCLVSLNSLAGSRSLELAARLPCCIDGSSLHGTQRALRVRQRPLRAYRKEKWPPVEGAIRLVAFLRSLPVVVGRWVMVVMV